MRLKTRAPLRWLRSAALQRAPLQCAVWAALTLAAQGVMAQPAKPQQPVFQGVQRIVQDLSQLSPPGGVYKRQRANGTVEEEVINAVSGGRAVLRQLRYYDDGKIKQQLEWANGKLNGTARLHLADGSIFREANYVDNRIETFTEYRQRLVYNQITSDTRSIVNRGKRISLRWDKFYDLRQSQGKLLGLTKDGLITFLLAVRTPEEATQVLADIAGYFESKASGQIAEANDVVSCGNGKAGVANDANLNNATLQTASASRGKGAAAGSAGTAAMATVHNAVSSITSACGAGSGAAGARAGANLGVSSQRDAQIAQAEQVLDAAIQSCRSQPPRPGSGMFAGGVGGFTSLLPEVEAIIEGVDASIALGEQTVANGVRTGVSAVVEGAPVVEASVADTAIVRAAAATTASASQGFVLLEVLSTANAVAVGAVVGWAIGTAIDQSPVGQALTQKLAEAQYAAQDREYEEAAQKEKDAKSSGKKPGTNPPAAGGGAGRPDPDSGGGDKCDGLENFKNTCEMSNWTEQRCAAFAAMASGCTGDPTRIQYGHDGDVFTVACPSRDCSADSGEGSGTSGTFGSKLSTVSGSETSFRNFQPRCRSEEELQTQRRCEQQGLIGRPGPDGTLSCGTRNVNPGDVRSGPNPHQINPTRE